MYLKTYHKRPHGFCTENRSEKQPEGCEIKTLFPVGAVKKKNDV